MKKAFLFTAIFLFLIVSSQESDSKASLSSEFGKNIIKINVASLAIKNYSFQFERVLTRKTSIAIGFSYMPNRTLPFVDEFKKILDDDDNVGGIDTDDITDFAYDNFRIGYFSITPEFRWYLGKGYGKGFYFAPYYRFAKVNAESIEINYERDNGDIDTLNLNGNVISHSGGLMIGTSFNLGKHLVLDWWIVGLHVGGATGQLNSTTTYTMTSSEQQRVRDFLNDLNTDGIVKIGNEVSANNVKMIFDGPWAGIRTGLSLGYRF
jgi:hypothetical protein